MKRKCGSAIDEIGMRKKERVCEGYSKKEDEIVREIERERWKMNAGER